MRSSSGSHSFVERRLRGRKRALVVDGDVLSRIETRLLLEMQGYQVEEVSDGMEAVGLLDVDAPVMDLIVLDYQTPLLHGLETLQALRALQPGLKALLCLAEGEAFREDSPPEMAACIQKPLTPRSLAEALDKAYGFHRHALGHGKIANTHWMKIQGHLPHYPPR